MAEGYEVAHLDELDRVPLDNENLIWRPVRRRFGIGAFGTNAYTAANAGDRVVEEHREPENHEEMYVVLAGRATFTLGDDEVDAPAGTFAFVRPGIRRGAVAVEPNTSVLAVGAKRGVVFEPSTWETYFAAFGYQRAGDSERGREEMERAAREDPDNWRVPFNYACFEALEGNVDAAIALLRRAIELEPEEARKFAVEDTDFDGIRDRPEFQALLA
jgi:tetratricopeptide (TPR) repeat protein